MKPIASEKELVVFLSGEIEKENSSERNSSLKLDPVKTQKNSTKISKKTKREELKEISNANNGDSAGKKKSHKRRKICKEVPNEEKGNASDGTEACRKVSEKETMVDSNHKFCHNKILLGTGVEGKSLSGVKIPEYRNHHFISVDPANDFINSVTSAPKKNMQHMHAENWNSTVTIDSCVGAKVQVGIAKFASVGMNLVMDKTEEEIPLPPGAELTKVLDIELPPENVGNALQLLEFCRVFGKEKGLRKKLQDETVKGIMLKVTPLLMEKHNSLLAKLKSEVVQAHDEVLKLKRALPKEKHVKIQDETASSPEENWFIYGPEKKEEVDKYIYSRSVLFLKLSGLLLWFWMLYMALESLHSLYFVNK
ncbi:hypothetical protein V8G54_013178 [Vigna mungo]|uniref:Uncharacterized protein n=1 Tax=Vigna mungo TaxID=3915 RepID=A0AAQ3NV73_VIGMU